MTRIILISLCLLALCSNIEAATADIGDKVTNVSRIDVRAFSDLASAVASSQTVGKRILLTNSQTVNNLTIPADREIEVVKGGLITVPAGKKLTINGQFKAGRVQCFAGNGIVSFGVGAVSEIYPEWWGATGDGKTDDTKAVQAAIASAVNNTVVGASGATYSITSVNVPNGIKACDFTKSIIKGRGSAPVAVISLGSKAKPLGQHAIISAIMDMSAGDRAAIQGHANDCIIERCQIYGFTNHEKLNHYGILLQNGSSRNIIRNNNIIGYKNPIQRGMLIALHGGGQTDYGGFFTGKIVRDTEPCVGNTIKNNILTDGSYAVVMLGCEKNTLTDNNCSNQNHRSIYLANACWENVVSNNQLIEYLSSAVLLAYGSSHNTISNNQCRRKTYLSGEAAINVNTGAKYNLIENNKIYAGTNYGIYLATDSVGNIVLNNDIENYYLAGIMLENDWINPRPKNNIFSRPNYAAPLVGSKWSFTNSSNNVIKGNILRAGYSGRKTAAIALAQIDAGGKTSLTDNTISDNQVVTSQNIAYNLHLYANSPAKFTGTDIVSNNFNSGNTFLSATVTGATKWSEKISYYANNKEFDSTLDKDHVVKFLNQKPVKFAEGDTSPSVKINSSVPNKRLYEFTNTAATNVTQFLDGIAGQIITLRLNAKTTIVHAAAKIQTKGSINVVGSSANQLIQFMKIGTVWVEIWRNF